jgi:V-type H+-transporting ATPase subunit G
MDIDRTKRIKEARDEAKKEIDTYRKTKEAEFKKFESEVRLANPSHRWPPYSARQLDPWHTKSAALCESLLHCE